MRTALFLLSLLSLASWGCGGGQFTTSQEAAGTGGDASATGGSGGSADDASTTGGSGGSAGSAAPDAGGQACNGPSDCPGEDNECTIKICESNVCQVTFVGYGTPTNAQAPGDCKQLVCDGAGALTEITDDMDLPVDGNPCTDDICTNGKPSNPFSSPQTVCGDNLHCDGNGKCIGCSLPSDCGSPDPCFTWACDGGTCSRTLADDGKACAVCAQCRAGICENVPAGEDPNGDCAPNPPCGNDGMCDGGGACRLTAPGTPCGDAPSCTSGVASIQDRCDGAGQCKDNGVVTCSPYKCSGAVCATSCDGTLDCVLGYSCDNNVCKDCTLCGEWYNNPSLLNIGLCSGDTNTLIGNLTICACGVTGNPGKCTAECAGTLNLCATLPGAPDQECRGCVEANCGSPLEACQSDQVN